MKSLRGNSRWLFIAAIAMSLTAIATGQVTSDRRSEVYVFGSVAGPAGPVLNQSVILRPADQGKELTTRTDESGSFTFKVRSGQHYTLVLAIPGFDQRMLRVDVKEKNVNLGIVGVSSPWPVRISGKLMSYTGSILPGEVVTLEKRNSARHFSVKTDQNGIFSFSQIELNSRYSLRISVKGFSPTLMDLTTTQMNMELGSVIMQPNRPLLTPYLEQRMNSPFQRIAVISGRILDANHKPLQNVVRVQKLKDGSAISESTIENINLSANGTFYLPVEAWTHYSICFTKPGDSSFFEPVAQLEVANSPSLDLGDIVLHFSSPDEAAGSLVGPVKVVRNPIVNAQDARKPGPGSKLIAAVFIGGGLVSVIHSGGEVSPMAAEKEQVGARSPLIAQDQLAAGWLVDSNFCCTSYPIDLMLAVYRHGKPLRRFVGDRRAIFRWQFVGSGKQVAFFQDFLHGTSAPHYELRNVETGRLAGKWDDELTIKAPKWTHGLEN